MLVCTDIHGLILTQDTTQVAPCTASPLSERHETDGQLTSPREGLAWGLTTPFIRRAAVSFVPTRRPSVDGIDASSRVGWARKKLLTAVWTGWDLLRTPSYAVPLVVNLTGSVWFFWVVGKAELSLTVPITNSLAFLFTVLGEWWAEGKVISRDTWIGMALVLGGIALCVQSKNT
ncbi:MAG: integral membrane [Lasallia pustulata]|uniref:Integral membrane n=1 Tax=Lasallia pustulata TaxID=136370 RepID=A0A5M8PQL3_9LECA|nr:MAG: integral membrane [Lasallia pustulata]